MKGSTKDIIQWHPAFHASIQIFATIIPER